MVIKAFQPCEQDRNQIIKIARESEANRKALVAMGQDLYRHGLLEGCVWTLVGILVACSIDLAVELGPDLVWLWKHRKDQRKTDSSNEGA